MRVLLAGLFAAAMAAGQGTIFHLPGATPTPGAPLRIAAGGTGATGASAARANLGAMHFAGVYSALATYAQGDIVTYNGTAYLGMIGENGGRQPDLYPFWWTALAGGGAVSSVFGRTAAVTAQTGDYTADQVTEGATNLYFTAGRAQAAMAGLYQAPITAYSIIAGLSGYPATFPPVNSGDWAGTWQTYAPSHFQAAISGESDIPGLVLDLAARPIKGPGYANGRAAMVNSTGALDAVTGASSDCVRVDGSSGPCAPVRFALIFDGSTRNPGDGSTLTWVCDPPGGGAQCHTTWTVPASVYYFTVMIWSAGAGGQGSTAGSAGGGGGGGGGYHAGVCSYAPGTVLRVYVGLGGSGGGKYPDSGGDSFVSTGSSYIYDSSCGAVAGGANYAGLTATSPPGYLYGLDGGLTWAAAHCLTGADQPTSAGWRDDVGGCGGAITTSGVKGYQGGSSALGGGGGGSGAYNHFVKGRYGVGFGGTQTLQGGLLPGAGGWGGSWEATDGYTACTAGTIPAGGGGGAGIETAGGSNHTGCAGARGEVRVYF